MVLATGRKNGTTTGICMFTHTLIVPLKQERWNKMALIVKGTARLRLIAGKAQPSPAIGQALGPLGVNMVEFCKQFNDKTAKWNKDRNITIPVNLTAYEDRTYTFVTKTPPTVWFLKQAAEITKCAAEPGKETVGAVSLRAIYEIAKIKKRDYHLQLHSIEALSASIVGTAKSIGMEVHR